MNGFTPNALGSSVYLLGPMTGYPKENRPMFRKATAVLRAMGFHVCSPDELDLVAPLEWKDPERRWLAAMTRDLAWLLRCDMGFALPGWRSSRGATLETCVLGALRKPVWEYAGPQGTFDADLIRMVPPDQLPSPVYPR
jgi:nucleoside 2-deoxyribosyltransferase